MPQLQKITLLEKPVKVTQMHNTDFRKKEHDSCPEQSFGTASYPGQTFGAASRLLRICSPGIHQIRSGRSDSRLMQTGKPVMYLFRMTLFVIAFLLPVLASAQSQTSPEAESGEPEVSDPATSPEPAPSVSSESAVPASSSGRILWNGMQRALQLAAESDKPILIFVFDPNCPFCQRMFNEVFPDPDVTDHISRYMLPVQIDVTSLSTVRYFTHSFSQREFADALGNEQVPTTYFMNSAGEIIGQQPGFIEPDLYATLIEFIGSGAHENQSFDQYRREQ